MQSIKCEIREPLKPHAIHCKVLCAMCNLCSAESPFISPGTCGSNEIVTTDRGGTINTAKYSQISFFNENL